MTGFDPSEHEMRVHSGKINDPTPKLHNAAERTKSEI